MLTPAAQRLKEMVEAGEVGEWLTEEQKQLLRETEREIDQLGDCHGIAIGEAGTGHPVVDRN